MFSEKKSSTLKNQTMVSGRKVVETVRGVGKEKRTSYTKTNAFLSLAIILKHAQRPHTMAPHLGILSARAPHLELCCYVATSTGAVTPVDENVVGHGGGER